MSAEHSDRLNEIEDYLGKLSPDISSRDIEEGSNILQKLKEDFIVSGEISSYDLYRTEKLKKEGINDALDRMNIPLTDKNIQRISDLLSI